MFKVANADIISKSYKIAENVVSLPAKYTKQSG